MRSSKIVVAIILLFLEACSGKQTLITFDKAKLDSLFSLIESKEQGMGSISIFQDGKQVYYYGFGYANVKDSTLTSASTKYRIGSVTKSFTAAIIMQLIEEKKITLDTRLSLFFPQIPNADKITIEQLLRHRSGLFNYTAAKAVSSWIREPITEDELIEKFVANGTVFEPNTGSEYSNTNYVLLSLIAQRIDKKAFSHILKERITQPLDLHNTYYGSAINPANHEAFSYYLAADWEQIPQTHMSNPIGAGAIVSNPTDLNRFYSALFTGKVVAENSLQEMKKQVGDFGIGMVPMLFDGKQAFGHEGGIDGFQTIAAYFPDEKVSVACTLNGLVMPMDEVVMGALKIYFGKPYSLPSFDAGITLTGEELEEYTGEYTSPTFPLKMNISRKENLLLAQAAGHPAIRLEAYDRHKFKADAFKVKIEFLPNENKMILDDRGLQQHFFTKEK